MNDNSLNLSFFLNPEWIDTIYGRKIVLGDNIISAME